MRNLKVRHAGVDGGEVVVKAHSIRHRIEVWYPSRWSDERRGSDVSLVADAGRKGEHSVGGMTLELCAWHRRSVRTSRGSTVRRAGGTRTTAMSLAGSML